MFFYHDPISTSIIILCEVVYRGYYFIRCPYIVLQDFHMRQSRLETYAVYLQYLVDMNLPAKFILAAEEGHDTEPSRLKTGAIRLHTFRIFIKNTFIKSLESKNRYGLERWNPVLYITLMCQLLLVCLIIIIGVWVLEYLVCVHITCDYGMCYVCV